MDTDIPPKAGNRTMWPFYGLCFAYLVVCLIGAWHYGGQEKAIELLRSDMDNMIAARSADVRLPAPSEPAPSPVLGRPSAPRAAVRPTPHPAPAAPAVAARTSWGTTDLDRAIAAFPSTNLEQAK